MSEQLQPREPKAHELEAGLQHLGRMLDEQERVYTRVMRGEDDDFWADVYEPIYDAVRTALAAKCTPEERWAAVAAAVQKEALRYATARSVEIE